VTDPTWARRRVLAPIVNGFYGRAHCGGWSHPISASDLRVFHATQLGRVDVHQPPPSAGYMAVRTVRDVHISYPHLTFGSFTWPSLGA
jgi:hypothetical protein